MDKDELALRFRIANIDTLEFAILEENYDESPEELSLGTSLNIGADSENHFLKVDVKFQFLQEEMVLLQITVRCEFWIEEKAWDSFIDKNIITVPQGFASHLAVITVGTARGVLHEKTNDTPFNRFILPTINITNFIKEDVVFDVEELSRE
jgi:hypothetical protein